MTAGCTKTEISEDPEQVNTIGQQTNDRRGTETGLKQQQKN